MKIKKIQKTKNNNLNIVAKQMKQTNQMIILFEQTGILNL